MLRMHKRKANQPIRVASNNGHLVGPDNNGLGWVGG
jgi:hypothetical protein